MKATTSSPLVAIVHTTRPVSARHCANDDGAACGSSANRSVRVGSATAVTRHRPSDR
ncbi:Uncharacterised protein [Mycobacteroides abscessus subsp. abscessus]|nr:Uncharacterised protein [Mycobacteroides abscessus subsp. abscessus]